MQSFLRRIYGDVEGGDDAAAGAVDAALPPVDTVDDACQPLAESARAGDGLSLVDGEESAAGEVCKHWRRRGYCIFGRTCKFEHPEEERGALLPPPPADSSNKARRKANRGVGKRNSVKNRFRASAFRRFLIDIFGEDTLRSGAGVLDVAGGKGELSFEFVNLHGLQSTVVDPRPLHLAKYTKYLKKGLYHRNAIFCQTFFRSVDSAREEEAITPPHLRMCLEPRLVELVRQSTVGNAPEGDESDPMLALRAVVEGAMAAAAHMRWTRKGLLGEGHEAEERGQPSAMGDSDETDSIASSIVDEERWESQQVGSAEEAIHLLLNCSALVGMHPDQATEPIVDLALSLGKPFAVVPCCVYGRCFPRRKTASGEPVNTYDDFVEYLLAKSPSCACMELPFEGRNKVVYSTGAAATNACSRPDE